MQHFGTQEFEYSDNKCEPDEPEVRDGISTLTFKYEVAYYTKDNEPIYQFKLKEDMNKLNKQQIEMNKTNHLICQ